MEYKLISAQGHFTLKGPLEKLTQAVNAAIAGGWEPLGGVAIKEGLFVQAMIKRR